MLKLDGYKSMNILQCCVVDLVLFILFHSNAVSKGFCCSCFEIKLRNLHGYSFGGKGLKS
jgi:hypothetical protein